MTIGSLIDTRSKLAAAACIALLVGIAAYPLMLQIVRQISPRPALWNAALTSTNDNWALTWEGVDNFVGVASDKDRRQFGAWTPPNDLSPIEEALLAFIWVRLNDRGEIDLKARLREHKFDSGSYEALRRLYLRDDRSQLAYLKKRLDDAVRDGKEDFDSLYACGLVPAAYIGECMSELLSIVDLDRKIIRFGGRFGEEAVEMQRLLRKRAPHS